MENEDERPALLSIFRDERAKADEERKRKWAAKTNREKAEALIATVDPEFVRETDLRRIALAQVHATLALKHYG